MAERIVYGGKVYGNNITTPLTVVAKEDYIDPDGTHIYTINEEGVPTQVEIAGGARIKYGMEDLGTVIVQGIKMTVIPDYVERTGEKHGAFIRNLFDSGAILPTDLYTSIKIKHGFLNSEIANTSGKFIPEEFSLKAIQRNGNNLKYIITVDDSVINNTRIWNNDTRKDLFMTSTGSDYNDEFLDVYGLETRVQEAENTSVPSYKAYDTTTSGTFYQNGIMDYLGFYFMVGTVEDSNNPIYAYNDDTTNYDKVYNNGYVWYIPCIIGLKERLDVPKFNLSDLSKNAQGEYVLDFSDVTGSVSTNYTNQIVKYGNKYYISNSLTNNIWKEFSPVYYMGTLAYAGKTNTDPTQNNELVLDNSAETAVNVKDIIKVLFGNNIEFSEDETDTYIVRGHKNTNDKLKLECFTNMTGSETTPLHIIQSNNGYVTYYLVIANDFTTRNYRNDYNYQMVYKSQVFLAPFANEAEKNFAFGVRQDLHYITKEEYDSHVNGGETNE